VRSTASVSIPEASKSSVAFALVPFQAAFARGAAWKVILNVEVLVEF
jgi:hypothetical protein